jgi:membrane-bound lytic murein transglycosylase F
MIRRALCIAIFLSAAWTAAAQSRRATDKYDELFRKYAKQYFGVGFDWRVFKAQALTESNLNPDARSAVGARGIMQLMPSTFKEIQTRNPELEEVNDPRWNIAAGIYYNRRLWNSWNDHEQIQDRVRFMFGSYNAGRGTILKAKDTAAQNGLDARAWVNVETVAPKVPRWRHEETLSYIRRIQAGYDALSKRTGFTGLLTQGAAGRQ